VRSLEMVQNGRVVREFPVASGVEEFDLGPLTLEGSGWFLVRAVADVADTFRFASTGPFYVESEQEPLRVSRRAAAFFLEWVRERKARLALDDPGREREVRAFHEDAERFWENRLARANAD
jgi:hypothetical protein